VIFTKLGMPAEDEIIICTVKKILHNSVFVTLDEYKKVEGMLHISEIAPGRIRNIRDYVKPNKRIVCKVLRVNRRYGNIDVSLRRVTLSKRKSKLEEHKQELRAEKLLTNIAKQKKLSEKDTYEILAKPLIEKFDSISNAFTEILKNKTLENTKIPKPLAELLIKIVKEKTKLPEVKIEAVIKLTNYEPEGILKIKEILKKAIKSAQINKHKIEFSYISAPNYRLIINARDYKEAEDILKQTVTNIENTAKNTQTLIEWQKKS